jgi:Fe2+ or Zn2+ uptake regulation protein
MARSNLHLTWRVARQALITQTLREAGKPLTTTELAQQLFRVDPRITSQAVRENVQRLVREKVLVRIGKHPYRVQQATPRSKNTTRTRG